MKKLLLLCIASCLLFSLYGHSHPTYGNDEEKSVISSHKEGGPAFKAFMRLFDQTIKKIKNCKNCDDLYAVGEKFLDNLVKLADKYSVEDLTDAEEEKLEQRLNEILELGDIQEMKLCGERLYDETGVDGEIEEEVVEQVAPKPAEEVAVVSVDQFQNNGKGSPAYLEEMMDLMDDFEKQLNKCTSCERLTVLTNRFAEDCKEIGKKYGVDIDVKDGDDDQIDERLDEILKLLERKDKQLCGD